MFQKGQKKYLVREYSLHDRDNIYHINISYDTEKTA